MPEVAMSPPHSFWSEMMTVSYVVGMQTAILYALNYISAQQTFYIFVVKKAIHKIVLFHTVFQ